MRKFAPIEHLFKSLHNLGRYVKIIMYISYSLACARNNMEKETDQNIKDEMRELILDDASQTSSAAEEWETTTDVPAFETDPINGLSGDDVAQRTK